MGVYCMANSISICQYTTDRENKKYFILLQICNSKDANISKEISKLCIKKIFSHTTGSQAKLQPGLYCKTPQLTNNKMEKQSTPVGRTRNFFFRVCLCHSLKNIISHLFTRFNIYHHISSSIAHMPHFDIQILAVHRMFVT